MLKLSLLEHTHRKLCSKHSATENLCSYGADVTMGKCLLHWYVGSLPLAPSGKPGFYHAAAAKSLQSCLTLCDPIDGSPPGSPIPGILQVRTLEWVAISFSNA